MGYRTIGNVVVEWDDGEPLIFTMSETTGPDDDCRSTTIKIDLSDLYLGFEDDFLLRVKDHLIERRNKVALVTIKTEAQGLHALFRKVIDLGLFASKISIIDETFLLCLAAAKGKIANIFLENLRRSFTGNPYSPLFAKGLHSSDFPVQENKKGRLGGLISRILGKALSQAAVAHILDRCDTAYDAHKMDIGHYAFAHLAFAVFCRPESYRQIRLLDLKNASGKYFIDIVPAKTGVRHPAKIRYGLNEPLGVLLTKQRQNVITNYGHLVAAEHIEKLALFPARQVKADKSRWLNDYANDNFGMYQTSGSFARGYPCAIKTMLNDEHFTLGANALRHTVGTLLAQTGASAQTIQAVLKHASDTVCQAYVDIAFHGLIDELSDAMRPAFADHLPAFERFRSKNDPVQADRAIRSEDVETGRADQIGECGKNIACEYAPVSCYGCFRFIPCWDADHGINLRIVQREIDDFSQRGKAFQHMVERARTAKNRIMLVMYAADRYQDAKRQEIRA